MTHKTRRDIFNTARVPAAYTKSVDYTMPSNSWHIKCIYRKTQSVTVQWILACLDHLTALDSTSYWENAMISAIETGNRITRLPRTNRNWALGYQYHTKHIHNLLLIKTNHPHIAFICWVGEWRRNGWCIPTRFEVPEILSSGLLDLPSQPQWDTYHCQDLRSIDNQSLLPIPRLGEASRGREGGWQGTCRSSNRGFGVQP